MEALRAGRGPLSLYIGPLRGKRPGDAGREYFLLRSIMGYKRRASRVIISS